MIYSLNGTLIHSEPNLAVIECGGVGYKCLITMTTAQLLPKVGQQAMLFTHMSVREDAVDLFGFADQAELECFKMLTGVSGVGPKAALSILSELRPERLLLAIASNDAKTLTKCPGIGNKLAQRIVLELKDKVGKSDLPSSFDSAAVAAASMGDNPASQAAEALVALGYSQSEAVSAVAALDASLSVEELVRQGLKALCSR